MSVIPQPDKSRPGGDIEGLYKRLQWLGEAETMGASDGQTLNGWVPEKVPRVAEKILGGEKVKNILSEV